MNYQNNNSAGDRDRSVLSDDELDRLAELVAFGKASFCKDLSPFEQEELARRISALRRGRLLRHIARAIAIDIHREAENRKESKDEC